PLFAQFSKQHPEYERILMIRDLRDAIVSYAFHISDNLDEKYGKMDFDKKLTMILDLHHYEVAHEFEMEVLHALNMLPDPHLRVIKFEDVVGPKGGGNLKAQIETINALAEALHIELSHEKLSYILDNLFGNDVDPKFSATFRAGQIGSWKSHFKDYHRKL